MLYKHERKYHLIDITVPGDKRIELKEQEKIDIYSELRQEEKNISNLSQVVVVSVVIGALGVTSKRLKDWLEKLNIKSSIKQHCLELQKLGSPRDLRLLGATCSLGNIPELPTKSR